MTDVQELIKIVQLAARGEEVRDALVELFSSVENDFRELESGIDGRISGKQDSLTFDDIPTDGSTNPVTSEGIKKAISEATPNITYDTYPRAGSTNPVTSDGIRTALNSVSAGSASGVSLEMTFDPEHGDFNHKSWSGEYEGIFDVVDKSERFHKKCDIYYTEEDEELGTEVKMKLHVVETYDDRFVLTNIPYEGVLVKVILYSNNKLSRIVKQIKMEVSDEYYS